MAAAVDTLCRSLVSAPPVEPRRYSLDRSQALQRYAEAHIPAGSQTWNLLERIEAYDANLMYRAEMSHWFSCIEQGIAPCVGLEDAARVLEMALTARDQARPIGERKAAGVAP